MYTIYGIKNCDTVKKALGQLDEQGTKYQFVDLKTTKLDKKSLQSWKKSAGDWPINARSTTYRNLKSQWEKADEQKRFSLIIENPTLLKRPLLTKDGQLLLLGFKKEQYQELP